MSTTFRKALALGAAAVTAGAALTLTSAANAQAAAPCWQDGSVWYCNNATGANVYAGANSNRVVGRMYSNPSFFVCKFDGGQNHGGPHPTRWVHTQADNGQWGWMSDNDISSETNPLPSC
ncbi:MULTISPECIES: hypothetical protein [Streptomyces]|jgi:hypothetical protein|uniref:hypothetical protein n=1 Tax=Streptomyces TaxID=1883 RepID=UPI000A36F0ED|nr:hypothetical protein [Streptomyces glaucescens]